MIYAQLQAGNKLNCLTEKNNTYNTYNNKKKHRAVTKVAVSLHSATLSGHPT